jgi:hypothetical protein
MLAYITGTIDQELLLRNEYLAAENRILKAQIKGRLLLSEADKATLAEIAHRLGRKALEEVAAGGQAGYHSGLVSQADRQQIRRVQIPWFRRTAQSRCGDGTFGGADGEGESHLGL